MLKTVCDFLALCAALALAICSRNAADDFDFDGLSLAGDSTKAGDFKTLDRDVESSVFVATGFWRCRRRSVVEFGTDAFDVEIAFPCALFIARGCWTLALLVDAASASARCVLFPRTSPPSEGSIDLLGVGREGVPCVKDGGTPLRLLNLGAGFREGVSGIPPLLVGRSGEITELSVEKKLERLRLADFGILAILSTVRSDSDVPPWLSNCCGCPDVS